VTKKSAGFGAGITHDQLVEAAKQSGFPLQSVVAAQLNDPFVVIEEWGFLDDESRKPRTLDVFALRKLGGERVVGNLALLIECKRSDSPFVFFPSPIRTAAPTDFPPVAGLLGGKITLTDGRSSRDYSAAKLLQLKKLPFAHTPPLCTAFAKARRKGDGVELAGDDIFRSIVLPLVSASHHLWTVWTPKGHREIIPTCIALNVCVLDAPLVVMMGDPDAPEPKALPWARLVWQGVTSLPLKSVYEHHVIDFVQRAFLPEFISKHVNPFATEFNRRLQACESVFRKGAARVPNIEAWEWTDLKVG
jgi:hypothetical protein